MRALVAAALLFLAAAAFSAEPFAPVEPQGPLVPPSLPAERRPVQPAERALWRVRPLIGASTMRLGGLEHFGDASIARLRLDWSKFHGVTAGNTVRRKIDFALVEGLEASFQVDPLVSVAMKATAVRSTRGNLRTVGTAGTTRIEDNWDFSTEMLLVMAGAGFNLPLAEKMRLNITLFLGAGFADVTIDHRERTDVTSGSAIRQGTIDATGTAFIPEFTMELERDLTESLAVGAGLGYRFGGLEAFRNRYANSANLFSTSPEREAGYPVRDGRGALLTSDYGGLFLVLFFTARG